MNINVDFLPKPPVERASLVRSGRFFLNPASTLWLFSACPPCSTVAILSHWQRLFWCLNRMLYHVDLDYKAKLAPGVSPRPRALALL